MNTLRADILENPVNLDMLTQSEPAWLPYEEVLRISQKEWKIFGTHEIQNRRS